MWWSRAIIYQQNDKKKLWALGIGIKETDVTDGSTRMLLPNIVKHSFLINRLGLRRDLGGALSAPMTGKDSFVCISLIVIRKGTEVCGKRRL